MAVGRQCNHHIHNGLRVLFIGNPCRPRSLHSHSAAPPTAAWHAAADAYL